MYTSILEPSALCPLLILIFITLSPFYPIPLVSFVVAFPLLPLPPLFLCLASSSPKLFSSVYLLSSLPRTEPMFRFKFADAGNMSPPLISFSEVAFSYSGTNTHTHTLTHALQALQGALNHCTLSPYHHLFTNQNLDHHTQFKTILYFLLYLLTYLLPYLLRS